MCGIAGFVGEGNKGVADRMQLSLQHRGPDAEGVSLFESVGLVHRRLSIIDLSKAGNQPMSTADGRYTIVYNGEVYNHDYLRSRYLTGVPLKTATDTEVILYLFAKYGVASFDYLEGMYAVAIYDQKENKLTLHRDRLGKKPLFYVTNSDGSFIFASELKALHEHPSFNPQVDGISVSQYLLYEYIPGPRTIYQGVYKLGPGQTISVRDGVVSKEKEATAITCGRIETMAPDEQFEKLFSTSVKKRLIADVPVGVFLSGGLDSSLVAAYAQEHSSKPIKTFSIGFESKSFNEQESAKEVAKHLGTEHYTSTLSETDINRLLPVLPEVLDEPMGDSSIIPTLLVSEHARQQVTVSLSGDGADELFLGYDTFFAHRIARYFEPLPLSLKNVIYKVAMQLPVSHTYMSLDFKIKRFLSGCVAPSQFRNTIWLSALSPEHIHSLTSGFVSKEELFAPTIDWTKGVGSVWEGVKREYRHGYLIDDILVKADRASMHYGLEIRSPFLDEEIVSFANQLDDSHKLRGRTGKYLVRKIAERRLPKSIVWGKKHGFNFPVGEMICGVLKSEFKEVLLGGGMQKLNMLNRDSIEQLLTDHINGCADHRKALWSLYVLGKWANKWL